MYSLAGSLCICNIKEGECLLLEAVIQAEQFFVRCSSFALQTLILHLRVLVDLYDCCHIASMGVGWEVRMIGENKRRNPGCRLQILRM